MRLLVTLALACSLTAQTPPATKAPATKAPGTSTAGAPKAPAAKATPKAAPKTAAAKPAPVPPVDLPAHAEPGLYGAMDTTLGRITFQLYERQAPLSVKNFVELAQGRKSWFDEKVNRMVRRPLYPGITFHRVIPDFMVQAGDPTGTGAGNVGFTVPDEFATTADLKYDKPGRFGMANVGRPDTNSSQFFITVKPTPWLDGRHTVFGQVLEGQEIVDAITNVPRGENDKPNTPVKILRIQFQRVGPKPPNAPEGGGPPTPTKKSATKTGTAPTKKAAAPPAPPTKK